jgi:hypothetical protein
MTIFESIKNDESFSSIYEYEDVVRAIEDAISKRVIERIPVLARRRVPQVEEWYREVSSGAVYSLRPPEFPARGYWGAVPLDEFEIASQPQ